MNLQAALERLKAAENDLGRRALVTADIAVAAHEPAVKNALNAAAVPHWFDHRILKCLLGTKSRAAAALVTKLSRLPMVEPYGTGRRWNVHESARLALRRRLAREDPGEFRTISARAARCFVGDDASSRIEVVYHLLSADPPEAVSELDRLWKEWHIARCNEPLEGLAAALDDFRLTVPDVSLANAASLVFLVLIRRDRLPPVEAEQLARAAVRQLNAVGHEWCEATAREVLGDILEKQRRLPEALEEYEASKQTRLRLIERDRGNINWQGDLSRVHKRIGHVYQAQDQPANALREYHASRLNRIVSAFGWFLKGTVQEDACTVLLCKELKGGSIRSLAVSFVQPATVEAAVRAVRLARAHSDPKTTGILLVVESPDDSARLQRRMRSPVSVSTMPALAQQATGLDTYAASMRADHQLVLVEEAYVQPVVGIAEGVPLEGKKLDDIVLDWLAGQDKGELWVLGDFGMGKTWFTRHFASVLLQRGKDSRAMDLVPVLVPLRDFTTRPIVDQLVTFLEGRGARLVGGADTLNWMIDEGRLLFILDGVDEAFVSFLEIQRYVNRRCHLLVTCRTHYFERIADYRRELMLDSPSQRPVKLFYTLGFDKERIIKFFQESGRANSTIVEATLTRYPELADLARRPLFLKMLVATLQDRDPHRVPTSADAYEEHIQRALELRWHGRPSKQQALKCLRGALESLAWRGQCSTPRKITFDRRDLRETALAEARKTGMSHGLFDLETALRAEAILVRTPTDKFAFGHLSFQEYLAALRLSRMSKTLTAKMIGTNIHKEDWREVLWLYASVVQDASLVLDACLNYRGPPKKVAECLFLAARSLEAARRGRHPRAAELGDRLMALFKGEQSRAYAFLHQIYQAIRRMGEGGKETLRRHLGKSSDHQVRRRCILTFYESFGHDAFAEVLPYLDSEKAGYWHVRWHAAEVVAEVAEKTDLRHLKKYADDRDVLVRGNVRWAFSRHRAARKTGLDLDLPLLDALKRNVCYGENIDIQAHSALLLGRCVRVSKLSQTSVEEIGRILAGFLSDQQSHWRGYVARALHELGWADAVPVLCSYVADGNDDEIWLKYAVDAIKELATSQHAENVRMAADAMKSKTALSVLHAELDFLAARLALAGEPAAGEVTPRRLSHQ